MAETTAWRSAVIANSSLLSPFYLFIYLFMIFYLFMVNVIRQMAPLFSQVDSNKLWHDVQHEENVICAKFCKDMFNISKVIGRKTVAQLF